MFVETTLFFSTPLTKSASKWTWALECLSWTDKKKFCWRTVYRTSTQASLVQRCRRRIAKNSTSKSLRWQQKRIQLQPRAWLKKTPKLWLNRLVIPRSRSIQFKPQNLQLWLLKPRYPQLVKFQKSCRSPSLTPRTLTAKTQLKWFSL